MDNPSAFPRAGCGNHTHPHTDGMTLRDYFAGQALAGLLSDPNVRGCESVAKGAFQIADHMLALRTSGETK